ncbi:DGCR6 protein, partial [Thinocorus orbignyianus]|nr:DGCR6 protein [Thinocorus orbignyianus]
MERFGGGGAYESAAAEQVSRQQERHYRLLSELQALVKALPSLGHWGGGGEVWGGVGDDDTGWCCALTHSLSPTGLKQELFHRHKEAQQCCRPHNLPLLRAAQQREMEAVEQRIRQEQRMMDEKIVLELDQKVIDQQSTLEKAGVSGFYITTNPQELTLQMNLLELIRKLQQKEAESEKAFS